VSVQTPFLIGESIYLRPLSRADAPVLQRQMNDPEVNRTLAVWRPMTLENELDFIDRAAKGDHEVILGIAKRDDDRLIGDTALHQIDWRERSASFGIQIGDPGEWGKGYGSEATRLITGYGFERLNLNRIWLYVYDLNPRGAHVYEKVGYKREGVLREGVFREGRYRDVILMAILASEWRAAHPRT
jgi:RimJ/RimL family protein N-acetyltransferase